MKKRVYAVGIAVFAAMIAGTSSAWAKPEYAAQMGVSCTACHVNVWGGGPRNVYGKFFGSRGLGMGRFSNQDLFSASIRGVAYFPKTLATNSNGVTLMEASGSVNAPVIESSDSTSEVRFVGTYNMAPLAPGAREAYARVTYASAHGNPIYVTIGRFNPPFGLMTDEHRTYTRIETNSTINNFFEGAVVSGTLISGLNYDLGIVNDLRTGDGFNTSGASYGFVGNTRYMPPGLPFFVGLSQNFDHLQNTPDAYATSAYTVFSVYRMTSGTVPLSVLYEYVTAKGWNDQNRNQQLGNFFIPSTDAAYQAAINDSTSQGMYGMLRYDLNQRWMVFYKYDRFTPDTAFGGDYFERHGIGFEVHLNSNTYLNWRVEKSFVSVPTIENSGVFAAQDDMVAMIRLWI